MLTDWTKIAVKNNYFCGATAKIGPWPPQLKYKNIIIYTRSEPDSSVCMVSGYGLDDRAIEVRSPAEAKGFFL
jgi:hypothetical protein